MTDEEKAEEGKEDMRSKTMDFMNMLHDNNKSDADRAMALQKMMFESQMDLISKMQVIKDQILAAVKTQMEAVTEDIRKRDTNQHEKRGELATAIRAEIQAALAGDKATSFKELILSPKLFKEWGAALAAVAMMLILIFKGEKVPEEKPKDEKKKSSAEAKEKPSEEELQ